MLPYSQGKSESTFRRILHVKYNKNSDIEHSIYLFNIKNNHEFE